MALEITDNLVLGTAATASKQLADVTYIKGAFKTYMSASDMQNAPLVSIDNKQIAWLENSSSLYQATKTLANPPFTFTDTVEWNEFSFGGGSTNTGSLLITASVAGSDMTFTKGDNSTFVVALPGGGGTPGGSPGQIQFNSAGAFAGSSKLKFSSTTGLTQISGSLEINATGSTNQEIFLIKSGSRGIAKVTKDGTFVLIPITGSTPTSYEGSLMYSSSALYVGTG
jgi:hypothetical protein